jgi:predicted acylesterase/phospholipase RssA
MQEQPKRHQCDLIMKGGTTSGVIYPKAILRLSEGLGDKPGYDFVNIGGTSAGAIAATFAAALQYAINKPARSDTPDAARSRFRERTDKLTEPYFLLNLFRPTNTTRELFEVFLCFLEKRKVIRLLRACWRAAKLSVSLISIGFFLAITGLISILLGYFDLIPMYLAGLGIWCGLWLTALGVIFFFVALLKLVPGYIKQLESNNHGFVKGTHHAEAPLRGSGDYPVLCDWIEESLRHIANMGSRCLTFEDLEDDEVKVTLRLLTSNSSQNLSYVLPLDETEWLIFDKKEFSDYFPDNVIKELTGEANAEEKSTRQSRIEARTGKNITLTEGLFFLPTKKLPLVVAARMSLSFPILFSAVPLYTIPAELMVTPQEQPLRKSQLILNHFTDGGLSSNLPVHFYDKWMPLKPTFCLNLSSWEGNKSRPSTVKAVRAAVKAEDVAGKAYTFNLLPSKNSSETEQLVMGDQTLPPSTCSTVKSGSESVSARITLLGTQEIWQPDQFSTERLGAYIVNLFSTTQNNRDNENMRLPSVRDRVVSIALDNRKEGGLNLTMDQTTVTFLTDLGEEAAQRLLNCFDFEKHQWVRAHVLVPPLLAGFDRMLKFRKSIGSKARMRKWLKGSEGWPYTVDAQWSERVGDLMDRFAALKRKPRSQGGPSPRVALGLRKNVD